MAEIIEIARLGLCDQVANRLRTLLVEGAIEAGSKLNERALCEQLRVSRTPLREALKLLAGEGLVMLLPNRGAVAISLDESAVRHTFEVLAAMEGLSGELAAQRATAAEVTEVKALHYEMMACFTRHDLSGYYRLNAAIHSAINAMAKNPVLTASYRAINARVQFLRFSSNQNENKWKAAVEDHEAMLVALQAGDGARLRAILVSHIERKRDVVLAQLQAGSIVRAADR